MRVKNPDIVEKILLADSESRLELIRNNAENLTVSDLNEISARLIENLTNSVESYDQNQRLKKEESLKRKVSSPPIFAKKHTHIAEKTTISNDDEMFDIVHEAPEEIINTDEMLKNADELEVTEVKKPGFSTFFALGMGISAFTYIGVLLIFGSTVASLWPLVPVMVFAIVSMLGAPGKPPMLAASIVMLAANVENMLTVYNNLSAGDVTSNPTALVLSAISLALLPLSLLWTDKSS